MEHQPDIPALADFVLVAGHGGFGKAARAAGRPKATLSRHVRNLEADLGLRLLDRDTRTFRLTEEGRLLCDRMAPILAEISEITTALIHDRGKPRGKLRVSCPLLFGHLAMGRIAAGFTRQCPEVQLEVMFEDRQVDLIEDGYDVVIRINPRSDSPLVGRCIHRDDLLLVAPAGLCLPADPATPIPAVTGAAAPDLQRRMVMDGNRERHLTLRTVLRLPAPLVMRDAVLAGAGVGVLPRMLVTDALARGALQNWGRLPDSRAELWALHSSRRLTSAKVQAFVDYLAASVQDVGR